MAEKLKWLNENCNHCGKQINSWDKRIPKTLVYRYPCCEACIAEEYGWEVEALRAYFKNIFDMRPCM